MPQGWASQDSDDSDYIGAWMARRNAQLALQPQADAFARDLWNQTTQNGDDLYAGNPSDLTAIGLAALGGAGSYLPTAANEDDRSGEDGAPYSSSAATYGGSLQDRTDAAGTADHGGPYLAGNGADSRQGPQYRGNPGPGAPLPSDPNIPSVSELEVMGPRPTPAPHPGWLDDLNHNQAVRGLAGVAGYAVGLPAGALRGGWHALEGVGNGLNLAGSLFFPEGRAKAWSEAQAAAHNALQYGRSVLANPSKLASDALSGVKMANRNLNPLATPIPDTASGAFGHELGIGANGGETLANIAGLFAAPEFVGGLNAARTFEATREANVAEMMEKGLNEPTARYLSKPYKGQGDHVVIPQAQDYILGVKAPAWFKNLDIPNWIMDSPLNVSKPRGMSQGDFYEYHYGVDPRYHGGTLPRAVNGGKGWSGKRLGLEKDSGPGRVWARVPSIYKDYSTGVASGDTLRLPPRDTSETPQ